MKTSYMKKLGLSQGLKSEVSSLQDSLASQEERLSEIDKEAKAHSASNKMLKEELTTR